jgi:hypothetical protein
MVPSVYSRPDNFDMTHNHPPQHPSTNKAARAPLAPTWKQHLCDWSAYATAAGAALAMSTNASAQIVTMTPDLTVSKNGEAQFNIGGDIGFLGASSTVSGGTRTANVGINAGSGKLHFKLSTGGQVKRYMSHNAIVAAGGERSDADLFFKSKSRYDSTHFGNFGPGDSAGFVGFENALGDLGWLKVKVTIDGAGFPTQLELISWAYNSVPGGGIQAGQTSSTPEPGTAALSLLALGAAGILALRKRRKEHAAN